MPTKRFQAILIHEYPYQYFLTLSILSAALANPPVRCSTGASAVVTSFNCRTSDKCLYNMQTHHTASDCM